MRAVACLLLLLAVPAAQAQTYKCVDPSGKTRYSDKPITDCKNARTITTPAPPPAAKAAGGPGKMPPGFPGPKAPAKPATKAKSAEPPKRVLTAAEIEQERRVEASRCKTLREEEAWLKSPRGAGVESQAARLGQVRQALAACR
jgi:hypothetical protein